MLARSCSSSTACETTSMASIPSRATTCTWQSNRSAEWRVEPLLTGRSEANERPCLSEGIAMPKGAKTAIQVGQQIGDLTIREIEIRKGPNSVLHARCLCRCGRESAIIYGRLRIGHCGACGRRWRTDPNAKRHRSEYMIWVDMRRRCNNPKRKGYRDYGGRGIRVCEQWNKSFEAFFADMGPRPSPGHSLDRYPNNDGNYEPGNVRWATDQQQGVNKRKNRFLEFEGLRLTVSEWAVRKGLGPKTILYRLKAGWSVKDALTTSPDFCNRPARA